MRAELTFGRPFPNHHADLSPEWTSPNRPESNSSGQCELRQFHCEISTPALNAECEQSFAERRTNLRS